MPEKLSDYVARFVAERGVRHVFLLPGGGAGHLNDSVGKHPGLEYVCCLHEQAVALAAEAYSRVTNDLACAMVTTGPGGTNAVTGVAAAWLDSTPVLFVSGQVKRADLKAGTGTRILGSQEIDIVSIVGSITKYAVTILDPATIRFHLEKAYHLAMTGRRGPVWIDIPLDVQAVQIEPDALHGFDPAELPPAWDPTELPGKLAEVAALLAKADRPVLLVGNGVRTAGAAGEFVALAERIGVPVQSTWLGLDLMPADHPLFAGRPGVIAPRGANFTIQNCDLLVMVGTRMDMALTAYAHDKLARAATKVMVDIDPAEIRKMRTPIHVPIVADAGAFLRGLAEIAPPGPPARTAWLARCRDWKARYPLVTDEHRSHESPLSMYHFADVLSDELAAGDVLVPSSSGFASEIFFLCLKPKPGQRIFHNRGTGAMGFAIPGTVGACLAAGGRRTVTVDGDGGFQMNVQELATVARLGLPIKLFVVNNNGYASIRSYQTNTYGRKVAADATSGLTLPDLGKIAAAYDLPFARVDSASALRTVIRDVLDRPGPIVCEVVTLPDEVRTPRIASTQRPDGSIVSTPLEDLWPFLPRDEFRANMLVPPLEESA